MHASGQGRENRAEDANRRNAASSIHTPAHITREAPELAGRFTQPALLWLGCDPTRTLGASEIRQAERSPART